MNKIAKYYIRFSLILLIAAWAVHFIYPIYYSVAITNIKTEQKQVVETAKLKDKYTKLILSTAQFNVAYKQGEKELSMGNEMYELISFEKKGNNIECLVLHDSEESVLNWVFSSGLEKEKAGNSSKQIVFWAPTVCEEIPGFQFHKVFENSLIHFSKIQAQVIHSGYLSYTAKPPELV